MLVNYLFNVDNDDWLKVPFSKRFKILLFLKPSLLLADLCFNSRLFLSATKSHTKIPGFKFVSRKSFEKYFFANLQQRENVAKFLCTNAWGFCGDYFSSNVSETPFQAETYYQLNLPIICRYFFAYNKVSKV